MKFLITSAVLLVGLSVPQLPAQAYCSYNLDPVEYSNCLDRESRLEDIERRQREIERQNCRLSGKIYCF